MVPKGYSVPGTLCPKEHSVAGRLQPGTERHRTFRQVREHTHLVIFPLLVFPNFDPKLKYEQCKFGLFLKVHHDFSWVFEKNAFGLLNPNPLEFLRYLFPFSSYKPINVQFVNSA
jgi:hypothetical protein